MATGLETTVIGLLAKSTLGPAAEKAKRREEVINILNKVSSLTGVSLLPDAPPSDFEGVYTYALVEYGVGKPKPVLEFFRDKHIKDAFRESFEERKPYVLDVEAENYLGTEAGSRLRELDYDPRRELVLFSKAFNMLVARTRTTWQVKTDHKLDDIHSAIQEALETRNRVEGSEDVRDQAKRGWIDEREAESRFRSHAILDYCRALVADSEELPYATLLWDERLPLLSSVYVAQRSEKRRSSNENINEDSEDAPATPRVETLRQALDHHLNLALEGGPGMGKSTQLHHLSMSLAEPWLSRGGTNAPVVPVRVFARTLAGLEGSMSRSLREAVEIELGQYLTEPLPSDFFEQPPAQGVSWLLLVDGLDEIVSYEQRVGLIRKLNHHATRSRSDSSTGNPDNLRPLFRFVVTSRPLPEIENFERDRFEHFGLRSFEARQVNAFANTWFAPDRGYDSREAEAFLRQVAESRIADLTGVPLLLTMAALLYQEHRGDPLPASRSGLYEGFVTALLKYQEANRRTSDEFREEWRKYEGRDGEEWADTLLRKKRVILNHLAWWRQEGGEGNLTLEATRYVLGERWVPTSVDERWLRGQIRTLLLRTGLVTRFGEEEAFLHQTFQEYLAASALAGSYEPASADAWWCVGKWADEAWREVILFLLGLWSDEEKVTRLAQSIRDSGEQGLLFVGTALAEGAKLEAEMVDSVIEALLERAKRSDELQLRDHPNALDVLGRFRHYEPVMRGLSDLVHDAAIDSYVRVKVAEALMYVGRVDVAISTLVAVIRNPQAHPYDCEEAIDALRTGGRIEDLLGLMHDPELQPWPRVCAARALTGLGRIQEAVPALLLVARDPHVDEGTFRKAVDALSQIQQVEELRVLLHDEGLASIRRQLAAAALLELRTPLEVARDSDVEYPVYRRAIWSMVGTKPTWREDVLALARDQDLDADRRLVAAQCLARFGPAEDAVPVLSEVVRDPAAKDWAAEGAVRVLENLGEVEDLMTIMEDRSLGIQPSRLAARALIRLGRNQQAATLPVAVVRDPGRTSTRARRRQTPSRRWVRSKSCSPSRATQR